jgi:rhodanese-related sulfurtransferase
MHLLRLMMAAIMSTSITLASCNPASTVQPTPSPSPVAESSPVVDHSAHMEQEDNFQRISIADAYKEWKDGKAVMIDVRSEDAYRLSHIKDAELIQLDKIVERAKEFKGKKIITYCACPSEGTSGRAVKKLKDAGIEDAAALTGGIDAWKQAGYPVVSASKK